MKKLEFLIGILSLLGNVHIVPKRGGGNFDIMLIPKKEPQPINYKIYEEYTPGKLEMVRGKFLPFDNDLENMLVLCLYNMGIREFISILPQESKEELLELLHQDLKK
ncbi:hypothetical protein [Bacillus sp. MB2021]|uniref:hypothetical protein n=1 Tax=Bacillus sp. MB2021 TaxID=1408303 RepID=UPI0004E1903B|nr:hypothetical protein [Bacillus sp. MB2021]